MSAPHSIGRHRYGVANVLSTISGSSCSCAIAATASMSSTLPAGLPIVSPKNAFVFGRTALPPGVRIVGIDPGQLHVHLAQQVLELVDRPAVQRRGRDDVVARLEQREQRGRLRGDPAGERDRAGAALEVRHPLLEHRDGRVHDPRVGVPVLLQVEVRRRRLRVLEHVAGGLEDRHRARAGVRVGPLPGVQLARLESERARPARAGRARRVMRGSPRKRRMIGVCRASSSRKQSWPYGASITWNSTGLPSARSAVVDLPRRRTAGTASRS